MPRRSGSTTSLRRFVPLDFFGKNREENPNGEPGTVYLLEPEIEEDGEVVLDTHAWIPSR
jgi:hypothetical protein